MDFITVTDMNRRLEAAGDHKGLQQLADLAQTFPDLRLFADHRGNIKYCSAEANAEVDTMEIDSCHECDGKPIKLWVFVTLDPRGTKLYSDPPVFTVADQNPLGFGEIPREGWEQELEAAGISKDVIHRVRLHQRGHPPINYLEVED